MCGIFGHLGNNFDLNKFKILGLYNDTRGGDSCGVFKVEDGNPDVIYGHDKTKLFKRFVETGEFNGMDINKPTVALGHCRKASVGAIGLQQAQPVVISDNGEVVFSMIHNGTLINYKELADKYNVAYDNHETDSQIFCKVVYAAGFNVLSEYDGAGAFVFWSKKDDCVYLFKGASLYYEDDKALYEERPLYCIEGDNSFWFSSMEDSLSFIKDKNDLIIDIECNTLYKIKDGRIESEISISRSERKQIKTLQYKRKNRQQQFLPYTYSGYDDYYEENYGSYYNGYSERPELCSKIDVPKYSLKNKIYFNSNGLYYIDEKKADGEIFATNYGYTDTKYGKALYFIEGVMMKSYFDYLCAIVYINDFLGLEDGEELIHAYLAPFSVHPVPMDDLELEYPVFFANDEKTGDLVEFQGKFSPYFNYSKYEYETNKDGRIFRVVKDNRGGWVFEQEKDSKKLDCMIKANDIDQSLLNQMIQLEISKLIK